MNDETESEGIFATLTKTIENNWRLLLVGVIILAIALNSSWSNNTSSADNKNTTTPTPQNEQAQSTEQPQETQQPQTTESPQNTPKEVAQATEPNTTNTVTTSNGDTIAEVAAKSEGVTHLARKAIKEYLGTTQENLSTEQKIYAEDYLSKKIGKKVLEIGEKVEFSTDLIKQSIEQSKGLNQKQIENLSKYVPLVKI